MKFAIDGGAFQQGIAAGILNVQVGLMNAIGKLRPDLEFVVIGDSRLPPLRQDLLDLLTRPPAIRYGEVGPAYALIPRTLVTDKPRVRFRVDGKIVAPVFHLGRVSYKGPRPLYSFMIESCSDVPAEISSAPDYRMLGIGVRDISIRVYGRKQAVKIDDPLLAKGFHNIEGDMRWTNGAAEIPVSLFPESDTSIELSFDRVGNTSYRVGGGLFDADSTNIAKSTSNVCLLAETAILEQKLRRMGVSGYIANHFLPVQFQNLKTYAILYDIIPELFPKYFGSDALVNFSHCMAVFRRSKHIFSISESSRVDLISAGVDEGCVSNIWIDASPIFCRRSKSEVDIARERFGLSRRPYIIMVATLEPRKNHDRLVRAFALLPSSERNIDLVFIGKDGWGTADLKSTIESLSLWGNIKIHNDVSNDDLARLYSGALFLAYPSLYEGFGLPVLEAMACGCPVLTSRVSSLPEISGNAAILVDPGDTLSIKEGLEEMLTSARLRSRLARRGLKRRNAFSWESSARKLIDVITSA